ncbi:MAG TPA: radical SAM protein [Negativicutes bacterium]
MESLGRSSDLPTICFTYPYKTKAISVTGAGCQLNCAHCGGHYLKHMRPLAEIGGTEDCLGTSWLVSGGCKADGAVPLLDHVAKLQSLKQDRRFNIHVGLPSDSEIDQIAAIADCISFDFVGDDATIREVFGTTHTVADYAHCYQALRRLSRVMPHICIGLHGGQIRGEYRAMELLSALGVDSLTFIIFTPTRGTCFADCLPPKITEVVELLTWARQKFPDIPLQLGCMRPGGRYRQEIDQYAVRLGMDTIVNPTPGAVALARELGLSVVQKEECCVL